jgi:hypothetical protein
MTRERITDDPRTRHAWEIKDLEQAMTDFTSSELREIPLVPPGRRLEQGATYVDLRDPSRTPFTAPGGVVAPDRSWLVPKAEVPYEYWRKLVGHQG